MLRSRSAITIFFLLACYWWLESATLGEVCRILIAGYLFFLALSLVLPPYRAHTVPIQPAPNAYILLTGCTNGIGLEMCRRFAAKGWNMLLVSRDAAALQKLQHQLQDKHSQQQFETITQDLATHDATEKVLQQLAQKGFTVDGASTSKAGDKFVDIVVHNAGFGSTELFLDTSVPVFDSMLSLHINTVVGLTHALLPGMIHRGRGRVAINSSMIGYLPSPRSAMYGATKAFLNSFAQSIQYEVSLEVDKITRGSTRSSRTKPSPNLSVVLVTPGATHTGFAARAEAEQSLIFRLPFLSSPVEPVASEAVDGIIAGVNHVSPGWFNRLTIFLVPKLPQKFGNFICFFLWGSGDVQKDFFATANDHEKEKKTS